MVWLYVYVVYFLTIHVPYMDTYGIFYPLEHLQYQLPYPPCCSFAYHLVGKIVIRWSFESRFALHSALKRPHSIQGTVDGSEIPNNHLDLVNKGIFTNPNW